MATLAQQSAFPGRLMSKLDLAARCAVLALALTFASPAPADPDPSAAGAARSEVLPGKLEAIARDLAVLRQEILAANTSADPAARAAAVDQATGTLARLVSECREVEQTYAGLQGSIPSKVGASAGAATTDLSAIVADLDAAASDLDQARTTVASLR